MTSLDACIGYSYRPAQTLIGLIGSRFDRMLTLRRLSLYEVTLEQCEIEMAAIFIGRGTFYSFFTSLLLLLLRAEVAERVL